MQITQSSQFIDELSRQYSDIKLNESYAHAEGFLYRMEQLVENMEERLDHAVRMSENYRYFLEPEGTMVIKVVESGIHIAAFVPESQDLDDVLEFIVNQGPHDAKDNIYNAQNSDMEFRHAQSEGLLQEIELIALSIDDSESTDNLALLKMFQDYSREFFSSFHDKNDALEELRPILEFNKHLTNRTEIVDEFLQKNSAVQRDTQSFSLS